MSGLASVKLRADSLSVFPWPFLLRVVLCFALAGVSHSTSSSHFASMDDSLQDLLKKAWHGGRKGHLSPLSEARAWALREIWRDAGKPDYGMLTYIAGKVRKQGGGNPTHSAMSQFFAKVDADPQWFPGKSLQEQFGPPSVITPRNQAIVARSAMAMKARGEEPTYSALVANNPEQLLNPQTGQAVGKKRVYAMLEERCYDDPTDPEDTWVN